MISSHYTFTRNQLEVFREICLGKETVGEIVESSSQSSKTVYRITEALSEFGIIARSEGRGARFSPSAGIHSAALKHYLLSKERPIGAIVGSKLPLTIN
jgi:DNA-binding IclR family transcriptional regulator